MKLILVLCFIALSQAMILCPPDYCNSVDCDPNVTAESCDGRFTSTGSTCGCCPSCIKQIKKGENCFGSFLLGLPPTAECGDKLWCNPKTMTCEKKVETCAMVKAAVDAKLEESKKAGTPLRGLHAPLCEDDGTYKKVQCKEAVCHCASKEGEVINGYTAHISVAQMMRCDCARDQYEFAQTGMVGRMFRCTPEGNYDKIQCVGTGCHCADDNGKQLEGSPTVYIWEMDKLQC